MYISKLSNSQILNFIQNTLLDYFDDIENFSFFTNEKKFISTIKEDRKEALRKEKMYYVLIKNIVRQNGKIYATGNSVVLTEDGETKSAQNIVFGFDNFTVSARCAFMYFDGSLNKKYATFMANVFGEQYKKDYNKYLQNDLKNNLLK